MACFLRDFAKGCGVAVAIVAGLAYFREWYYPVLYDVDQGRPLIGYYL